MKNFPLKVEWVAEHRDGDKCYYYPGAGWIGAHDGLVRGVDDTDRHVDVPEDATHVQIVGGKVQYVRRVHNAECVDIWRGGTWQQTCTLAKLPGTVVRIADGSVFGSGPLPAVNKAVYNWVEASEGWPTASDTRAVEVEFESGSRTTGQSHHFAWSLTSSQIACGTAIDRIVRWRHAS